MIVGVLAGLLALSSAACVWLGSRWVRAERQRRDDAEQVAAAGRLRALLDELGRAGEPLLIVDRQGQRVDLASGQRDPRAGSGFAPLPEARRPECVERLAAALDARQPSRTRLPIDGHWRELDIRPLALPSPHGPLAAVIVRDATEEEATSERLRRLAARNNAILRSSMDGFFVVNENYDFIEVNDAFCRMTGFSGEELLGMKISDLEVRDQPSGGVPSHTRTGLHHFPTAHRHKTGRVVHLEISVNVHHTDDRKILVGFARDVTERKRAQEEFARLSRQHRLILDSTAEGIFGVDRSGAATFVNPAAARLLGMRAAELIGRPAHEFMCDGSHEGPGGAREACWLSQALNSGGSVRQAEGSFVRAGGERFSVDYSLTPLFEGTEVVGAVIVFRDTTERKRAEEQRRILEEQMQAAQKLESLGLLAGGIAHDLNNMMVGILGNACLAQQELGENEPVAERLGRIITACERATKTIRKILAYSGQITCDPAPLDLHAFVADVVELLRPNVPGHIRLSVELDSELPLINADAGQLQQVLSNLIINAVEAADKPTGNIVVAAEPRTLDAERVRGEFAGCEMAPGPYVALIVRDDGCGIPEERLTRIFEPFFSEKGAGRGLGLAAMQGIVRAHGGAVRVASRAGLGTTFTVLLPAVEAPARGEPRLADPPAVAQACVLIVDDEEEVRAVMGEILSSRGMRVLAAPDGEAALALFDQHGDDVDLVVVDMNMPGISGAEVFDRIAARRPDLPVIITSGFAENSVAQQLAGHTPAAFLQKPFTLASLLQRIEQALQAPSER